MPSLKTIIDTWIFDLDNTLYSADSGIFQQVGELMSKFVANHLDIDIKEAKKIRSKYYRQYGTTLRGMMLNHGADPDVFLKEVHKLDYSIVGPDHKLNQELAKLKGRKIIYTNANQQHVNDILVQLKLTDMFDDIFDIKMADYIPKPETKAYKQIIEKFNINPSCSLMFDDIAKNLVPAKNVGFTSVWIDAGYENFMDDIESSKNYLDYKTKDLSFFLDRVNTGKI
jgi:putative hydrolase of the HAD superfamily